MDRRILFIVGGSFVYGTEVNMLHYMTGLRDKGWAIHCIVNGWNDGDFISRLQQENISFSVAYLGFFYIRKPLWTLDTLWHLPGAWIQCYRILRDFQPRIIFHVTPRTIFTLYPLLRHFKTCLRAQEVLPNSFINRILFRIASRRALRILAVSQAVKHSLLDLGVVEEKIRVVYNGLTLPSSDVPVRNRKFGNPIRMGVIGRISPLKGQAVVIEAMRRLALENIHFCCTFAGTGEDSYLCELRNLVAKYGLNDRVQWLGYVKDPVPIYADLDFLIVPSFTEAFGIVALEGGLCGLPVVASRIEGLTEVIQDNVTGLLFNPGDPGDLVMKIKSLVADLDLRQRIAQAGYVHVRSEFSQEKMIANTHQQLEALLTLQTT